MDVLLLYGVIDVHECEANLCLVIYNYLIIIIYLVNYFANINNVK